MSKPYIAFMVNWHTTTQTEREDARNGKAETIQRLLGRGSYIGVPVFAAGADAVFDLLQSREGSKVQSMSGGDLLYDARTREWFICSVVGWRCISDLVWGT